MKIQTTRFGELEVKKNDLLHFVEGILGFEQLKKFFVVDPGDNTLILWLQSAEDPKVAFPIMEPRIFKPSYTVKLLPAELAGLGLENLNDARIYSILTIPQDITKMSANLKAPIVINNQNNHCRQIVLQDNKLPVRYEMYRELKKYIVDRTADDSTRTAVQFNSLDESESTMDEVEDNIVRRPTLPPNPPLN